MWNNEKLKKVLDMRYSFSNKIRSIGSSNYVDSVLHVLDNLESICSKFSIFLDDVFQDDFRYIDYYDRRMTTKEALNYFNDSYNGEDKESKLTEFSLFCLMVNLEELFGLADLEEFSDLCELLALLDVGCFYENLVGFSSFLNDSLSNVKNEEDDKLSFLNPNNKYLIYFTGHSLEDIKRLPKDKQMQLIRKLDTPLATQDIIPRQESIDHVKDLYDVNIARVHFAKDYRISYVRYMNVTAILGFGFKTGKDIDYFRYDSVVKNKDKFYEEIENFYNGDISLESDHYKVIEILSNTLNKYKTR